MLLSERRAKIVATLGPSTDIPMVLERMVEAGVDVARLNLSHGTLAEHKRRIQWVRKISKRLKKPVAILLDLQGPKIRTGLLKNGKPIHLIKNSKLQITTKDLLGDLHLISTTYTHLPFDVKKGDPILLDDGKMKLAVLSKSKETVNCRVVHGGWLKEHAGMNLPGTRLTSPALTKKDLEDLKFGMQAGVDAIALSFVRRAKDILQLKEILKAKKFVAPVIAKIERAEALNHLDEIMEEAEGVMVARGDLGVELSLEKVPVLQKRIIMKANESGTLVITATQMLESMIDDPIPTRAEASDVANAIFDGTDAVMLSGETAKGKYPIETISVMARIIMEAEKSAFGRPGWEAHHHHESTMAYAVVHAACQAAEEVNAKAIMVFSMTGSTVRMISKLKPRKPIIGIAPSERVYRQMALCWGVRAVLSPMGESTDAMVRFGERTVLKHKILHKGDRVVVVSGTQHLRGATNMMKILTID
ncbi:MAG: pyruvate kinase [Deltaproteobacteria bacterium RIFCSPLOWO2_12_FULL_44_12]|nr:MAG: pyruvate kinase [Deltaproteobacteria bacterium RIFCSPHIGHO2_01_FULL_43_49]OGQ15922.1 MAG: pyruvate kinase [Deltaproteobacteria bacterium RIFCSPHIGHO2_02_FULL_44_53]OGQ28884.1 MAG: pyruvate kinase [Deltaproteobacteria bacterium RIFCSPHIGHO2_12_FULL_44_21]OGQ30976.1 MAG: pyruvate kinase [Deltaproteobacteria bacterium RIFCSPLOWO2_01_FULL_45_74]OGQ43482.1 MAG: pyruvate kinase [Deltaproteobacteria bacterium RIFCSPLOWO2_02_FULL_44_34]OGQ70518.1 MAG: pyruvate kinase [Deltaproteobacteria bacte